MLNDVAADGHFNYETRNAACSEWLAARMAERRSRLMLG